ncbi:hypothetical protein F511_39860 [Dorcoceras hygrometricum]|uniref:Uncharacterized protein n=1 Tax=Dorcoceras hygrometricum TaxID=472368 RepID=A0A2Z7AB83_9LAMI|nr:hypothetical protein F511_39860 [Dorcoceras hygrometricum]
MRIRPPEFETSICDVKYHVSLHWPPPTSSPKAAAAASIRRKIVSGQFYEENPFVLISSVLLVQAYEGVSFLVVDRIDDFYRNLPRRADVIVTTVGARHKCQQGPYRMLAMTDWFFQALSVIPRGSWDDVVRRFTMIRWVSDLVARYFVCGNYNSELRDTASRGPTTIVTPKSQFRTDPSDHGKVPSNIAL